MAKVTATTTVSLYTGLLSFFLSVEPLLHTENAGLLSKSAGFALRTYASSVVGGLRGGHGKPN